MADDGELPRNDPGDGLAPKVLQPEDETSPAVVRRLLEYPLRVDGSIRRDDDVGSQRFGQLGQLAADFDLLLAAGIEGALRKRAAVADRNDGEARRIVISDRKISLGGLEAGRIGVCHRMAPASKLARELHLERMSRVVGNENAHGLAARLSRGPIGVQAPNHRRSATTQGGKIARGIAHSLRTYPGRRALQGM